MHLGFLDRPLAVGLALSLIFGSWFPIMGIAIFFELLWLDSIPAGTYLPPQSQLSAFVCCEVAALHGLSHPGQVLPVVLMSIPLAWIGTRVESALRRSQAGAYDTLAREVEDGTPVFNPGRFVGISLLRHFLSQAALCAAAGICLYFAAAALIPYWPALQSLNWACLWAAALIGGVLALRIQRAYWVFGVGLVLFLLFSLLYGAAIGLG